MEAADNLGTAPALRAAWDAYVDGEAAAQAFLRGHVRLPAQRELVIRDALQAGQPDETLTRPRDAGPGSSVEAVAPPSR